MLCIHTNDILNLPCRCIYPLLDGWIFFGIGSSLIFLENERYSSSSSSLYDRAVRTSYSSSWGCYKRYWAITATIPLIWREPLLGWPTPMILFKWHFLVCHPRSSKHAHWCCTKIAIDGISFVFFQLLWHACFGSVLQFLPKRNIFCCQHSKTFCHQFLP